MYKEFLRTCKSVLCFKISQVGDIHENQWNERISCICRESLVESYKDILGKEITLDNTFIVWSVKALQNFKALASTNIDGDNVYVEYTYNGDRQEMYEDFYIKENNRVIR